MKTIKPKWLLLTLFAALFLVGPTSAGAKLPTTSIAEFHGKSVVITAYCSPPHRTVCSSSAVIVHPGKPGLPASDFESVGQKVHFKLKSGERKSVRIPVSGEARKMVRSYLETPNALRLWVRVTHSSKRLGKVEKIARFGVVRG